MSNGFNIVTCARAASASSKVTSPKINSDIEEIIEIEEGKASNQGIGNCRRKAENMTPEQINQLKDGEKVTSQQWLDMFKTLNSILLYYHYKPKLRT